MHSESRKSKVSRKGRVNRKHKPEDRPVGRLLAVVQDFKYILAVLKGLAGFRFAPQLTKSVGRLIEFVSEHSTRISVGEQPDNDTLEGLVRMAHGVTDDLYDAFEAFVSGAFEHHDNIMGSIRELAPEILDREGTSIATLQESLRQKLGDSENSAYEDIAEAMNAVDKRLRDLLEEARQALAERERQEDRAMAEKLLAEIASLVAA